MQSPVPKTTSVAIRERRFSDQKISVLTCYDATFAALVDGLVDAILVGDSLGMVIQGDTTTLGVTLEHMIYHSRAVAGQLKQSHLVVDLPFLSYQVSPEEALRSAGRLVAEGRAEAVKLEGGAAFAPTIHKIVEAGIPVMAHLGLTPQSVHALGGYKVQGKNEAERERLLKDAIAVQNAGAYALVLEAIPAKLAAEVTAALTIPTIGIGAGSACSGQVLVLQDMLGMNPDFKPKFVKHFASLHTAIQTAVRSFHDEVQAGTFPSEAHSFS